MGNKWEFGNRVEDILREMPQESQPETAADKLARETADASALHFERMRESLQDGLQQVANDVDIDASVHGFGAASSILLGKISEVIKSPELSGKVTSNVLLYVLTELLMATHKVWEPDTPFDQFCVNWCNKAIHYHTIRSLMDTLSGFGLDLSALPKV